MIKPVITVRSGRYENEEGCLSLIGERKCVRYNEIEVDYLDVNFEKNMESILDLWLRLFSMRLIILMGLLFRGAIWIW